MLHRSGSRVSAESVASKKICAREIKEVVRAVLLWTSASGIENSTNQQGHTNMRYLSRAFHNLPKVLMLGAAIQCAYGQDPCDAILANGIWDYQNTQSSDAQTSSFLSWFCSRTFSSYQEASNASVSLGIPLPELPLQIGGTSRDTKWSQYSNEMCRLSEGQFAHIADFNSFVRTASTAITAAWSQCMNATGTKAWIQTTQDPKAFSFQINRTTEEGLSKFKVLEIASVGDVSCKPSLDSAKNRTYTGSTGFLCLRPHPEDTVTLQAFVVGVPKPLPALSVKGILPAPPLPDVPPIHLKVFRASTANAVPHPEITVTVDVGYKIVGCGARANGHAIGSLLTAIYPTKTTCIAKAKDHDVSDPATIDAWAIALEDTNNKWDVEIFSSNSGVTSHPQQTVSVPLGYLMTGGGAQDNWGGGGNLLTASYPLSPDTWEARGKDHRYGDPANLTVFAIGIRPLSGWPAPRPIQLMASVSEASNTPAKSVAIDSAFCLTSGGAVDDYHGAGNLLTASYPTDDLQGWAAAGKAHEFADPASLTVWAIGIQKTANDSCADGK